MKKKAANELILIKYLSYLHLLVYVITISLAKFDGQDFQRSWIIHIAVFYYILIYQRGYNKNTFYSKIGYLAIFPTLMAYKLFSAASNCEIPIVFLVLNISYILCLYLIIPLLIKSKNLYLMKVVVDDNA